MSGTPAVGGVLSATNGGWIGPATSYSVTWVSGGVVVAEGASYTVQASDQGKQIVAVAHVVGGPFAPVARSSAPVTIPLAPVPPVPPTKARAKLKIKAPEHARPGSRPTITVKIKASGVKKPTGKIKVVLKKGSAKTTLKVKVKAKHKGKVKVRLPRLTRGTYKLKVSYSGSATVEAASTGWRKLVVGR